MPTHGKKYQAAAAQVDGDTMYKTDEAIDLLKKTSYVNFDPTIEIHMMLGVDPRHADQQVRATATLPHGTGKTVRVLVFAEGEGERIALDAGADYAGSDELINRVNSGWVDFDVAIAVADQMGKIGKAGLGKVLGRRGLMPNPKSGTIVANPNDLPRVISEAKGGRLEFRNDKTGLLHVGIGKLSFTQEQITDNLLSFLDAVVRAKPTGAKGTYVKSITLTSTMGPGIHMDVTQALAEASTAQKG
ncbi:MAG TPA: 50S ribosomal protein L1 [Chloroflexia bacterium]|jgi:large subunit ribosomal protein L1|nr:50S ribosomal protein L1 [Chloroflexia bacterium]